MQSKIFRNGTRMSMGMGRKPKTKKMCVGRGYLPDYMHMDLVFHGSCKDGLPFLNLRLVQPVVSAKIADRIRL